MWLEWPGHAIYKTLCLFSTPMSQTEYIYGRNPVIERLESGEVFEQIVLQKGVDRDFASHVRDLARDLGIPVRFVPKERMARITKKNHQGVVGFTSWVVYSDLQYTVEQCFEQGRTPLIVLLDNVTDVRNVGAIARSAEVFGVDALVVPLKGAARIGGDAVKTSAGAITRITMCRESSIANACHTLADMGLQVLAADQNAPAPLFKTDLTVPVAIVLSSEGSGLSDPVRKSVGSSFSIPQIGSTDSLNVSVAAGVTLYEVVRQRTT